MAGLKRLAMALVLWTVLMLVGCAPISAPVGQPLSLTVEEYPVVERSVDSPTHFEFNERIRKLFWISAGRGASLLLKNASSALTRLWLRLAIVW